jgi:hypothetical protein
MKTSFLFSARTWGALLFAALLATACEKEESQVQPGASSAATMEQNLIKCFQPVYAATIRYNARKVGINCFYSPGKICIRFIRIWRVRCWFDFDLLEKIPGLCLRCPEDIVKIIPEDIIPDFRRELGDNLPLDEKENAVFFPLTAGVVGLQSYEESEYLNKEHFYLKEEITLSEEEQKGLGVDGKVIPAGEYPVIYNERNNTFNAIIAVR